MKPLLLPSSLLCHLFAGLAQAHSYGHDLPPPEYNEAAENGSLGFYPTKTFVTQEDLRAPLVNYNTWHPACDDGLFNFITPRGWSLPGVPGPMILDNRGEVIWGHHFENTFGGQAYDFMVQKYRGQDYLTFWLGDDRVRGHGSGSYYMLNASYDVVHKVTAANGLAADLHEFIITPENTALLTVYDVVPGDVSAYRTFDPETVPEEEQNYVWDCAFQEVDIRTGELLFEWRASDHVAIDETFRNIEGGHLNDPWDWFHINSIDKDELGNFLISARYPHSMLYIDGKTQETIWQLGGKENDFVDMSDGDALNFAWQHDARFWPTDTFPETYRPPPPRDGYTTRLITVFDNAAEDQHYVYGVDESRGLVLEVTYPNPGTEAAQSRTRSKPTGPIKQIPATDPNDAEVEQIDNNAVKVEMINGTNPDWTVRLVRAYSSPLNSRSSSQGSMQLLLREYEDPKIYLGFGLNAAWAEFDANGTMLCDVHFGAQTSWDRGDIQSYRAYKMAWTGRPEWQPSIDISDDDAEVYVSWNGATDVVDWVLQCSETWTEDDAEWSDLVRLPRSGFETTIPVPSHVGDTRYLRVMALAANGRRLDYGTSAVIDRGLIAAYLPLLNHRLPVEVAHMSAPKATLLLLVNLSFLVFLYEVYRRFLSWRVGRPGAGPLRWRKAPTYRLLAEA